MSSSASPAPPTPAPPPPVPLRTERLVLRYHRDDDAAKVLRYYRREDTTQYLLDHPWDEHRARREVVRRQGRLHIEAAGCAVCLIVEEPRPAGPAPGAPHAGHASTGAPTEADGADGADRATDAERATGADRATEAERATEAPGGPGAGRGGAVVGDITLWAVDDSLSLGEISWVFDPDAGRRGLATEAAGAVLGLAFGHYGMHRVRARMDPRNTASARLCERLGFRREGLLRRDWLIKGEWTDTLVYGLLADERPRR